MAVKARHKGDKMLARNGQNESSVQAGVHLPPIAGRSDFESEAMPHLSDLYRTALYVCPHSIKASEVVRETYLRAWIAFGKYRPRTNCRRWLFQIFFNVVRFERQTRTAGLGEGVDPLNLAERVGKVDVADDSSVISALINVPMEFREVLLLVDCHGFSYKEAAEILGLSADIVARRIVRGRDRLHSELEACHSTLAVVVH
jgi:RNA polymerase sigma-70 factor (ECF subfamily)